MIKLFFVCISNIDSVQLHVVLMFIFVSELDTGTLRNHRRTRRCLVKNTVPTTKNWPLQMIYLAYPDRTIYNKISIQFSLIHLGSMVVMFFVVYWLLV